MARNKKNKVDYFSHKCVSGKTLFIIEERYKNDGYAVWFKLLELLGDTENHFYDCNNPVDFNFLVSKCGLPVITVTEIIDLLAELGAIDKELWSNKIIWSQNFVDGLAHLYDKRKQKLPSKPNFCARNNTVDPVPSPEIPHSIVKDSKEEDNTIPNGIVLPSATDATKILKEEYKQLREDCTGKIATDVYKLIKAFVEDKRPGFLEPYLDAWNIFADFQNLSKAKITDHRKKKIGIRAREPDFDFFRILASIKQNPDYRGENKSGWRVEFNYIIESEKNYTSILERYKEH